MPLTGVVRGGKVELTWYRRFRVKVQIEGRVLCNFRG